MVIMRLCYYSYVRRLSFLVCAVVLFSACGHKKIQVKAPQSGPVSSKDLEGLASYYAEPYHGRRTASGEIFDTYQGMTAAHRTLPFNTLVRVTNKTNGREVDVRINDRGPWVEGRVIDLSVRAARQIDLVRTGVVPVKLKVLSREALKVPTPSPIPGPVFAVQVGAFEDERAAENLKKRLEVKYASVTIQTFPGEKTLYRVRVGREPNLQAAEKLASQLEKQALKGFVVRTD
ncbi:MAG: septal ring lytic transglycosylase RlpA family lipoprotein [Acidobacteria bacterium]|nr:MAG: septal ring lytic transglycosylase RlpA family lipoprotein [Acidobacteriota bacterium]